MFLSWSEIIDLIGENPSFRDYYGKPVTYEMVKAAISPYRGRRHNGQKPMPEDERKAIMRALRLYETRAKAIKELHSSDKRFQLAEQLTKELETPKRGL